MKIVGRDIIDNNGKVFQIFGINTPGFEIEQHGYCLGGLWEKGNTIQKLVANIKSAGFNTVRIPINPVGVFDDKPVPQNILGAWPDTPNAGLLGAGSLEMLDRYIGELENQGVYFILDHHYYDAMGDIPALWYTSEYPEARWLADLTKLINRYGGYGNFIGIDIKNEPSGPKGDIPGVTWNSGDHLTDWKSACEKAFYAIDKIDKKCLIIVEPFNTTSINTMHKDPPAIPESRLLLSPHIYGPDVWPWIEGLNDPSFPSNQTKSFDLMIGDVAKTRAVYIGEFGGRYGLGTKDRQWQEAFVSYLRNNNIVNFSYWGYGPNSGGQTEGVTDQTYITYRTDKINLLKNLHTSGATFYDQDEPTKPEPEEPTREPFKKNDIIKHKSGTGPSILYLGNSKGEFFDTSGGLCRLDVDVERFYYLYPADQPTLDF